MTDIIERSCTCHPDDSPPVPCPKKYALRECVAALTAERDALRDQVHAEQRRALDFRDERDRLREALVNARATLERANTTPNGPIRDTIWHGDCETLFDYMDAHIDAAREPKP